MTPQVVTRPLTGAEYLESLRDGREVYVYGERVKDVTTHPAFRNAARTVAHLYDSLHDPTMREVLTVPTDTGNQGFTHAFFRATRSIEDLVRARDAIAAWARLTYGWFARSPDYKASFIGTLGANAHFYEPFSENARRWYKLGQERVLFWNHAIVNPPIDRHRPPHEVSDVYVHVERETDGGIYVSGAKVVATGSVLTHHNFLAHYGPLPIKDKRFALIFTAPINAPGLKLLSRPSYEYTAAVMGSPWDYPLSSRFDENDAILVFDNVFVPWENVFVYGDVDKVNSFFEWSGFVWRAQLHGCTRLAVKLDFLSGILLKAIAATGTKEFRGVQALVGEVIVWRNLFWALTDAMCRNPVQWTDGYVLPNREYATCYRVLAPTAWSRIRQIILDVVASGLIYLPSHALDFKNPLEQKYLETYVRGTGGINAYDRVKLMKLLYDATLSEFAGRHELYERNHAGNHENIRLETLRLVEELGIADRMRDLAEQCMAEYDLNGWVVPHLINNDDVSWVIRRFVEQQEGKFSP